MYLLQALNNFSTSLEQLKNGKVTCSTSLEQLKNEKSKSTQLLFSTSLEQLKNGKEKVNILSYKKVLKWLYKSMEWSIINLLGLRQSKCKLQNKFNCN